MTYRSSVLALIAAGVLAAGPALAEKPSWAGGGKGEKHEKVEKGQGAKADHSRKPEGRQAGGAGDRGGQKGGQSKTVRGGDARPSRDRDGGGVNVTVHFGDRQRTVVREYFVEHHSGGCPPGLAKKGNGCMPPGQAKKWHVGRPLPRDVIFYDLPPALVIELGAPPVGHRYVRVAADILLIAIGTGMVIDAIEDLGRL